MADEDNKPTDEVVEETNTVEIESIVEEQDQDSTQENDQDTADEVSDDTTEDEELAGPGLLQRFIAQYKAHKKITIPATVILVLVIIFVVPLSRYTVLGLAIKKDVTITIIDSETDVPVSGVDISLNGKVAKTDGEGKAVVKGVRVGAATLKASKKYYKETAPEIVVGLSNKPQRHKLEATGRQVQIHVVNKITGESIADATVLAADTEASTDKNGESTIVLPADQASITATVKANGYNELKVQMSVRDTSVRANTFALVPKGSVYFLSKKTGTIDVVKTDLDGGNRQTALAGTGHEEDGNTILLASRDWKYLALLARREDDKPRLYLLETGSDKLTEIDSGNASFSLVGWSDHTFVYKVQRENVQPWQSKAAALKTYNADTKQLLTLDETNAEGNNINDYAGEILDSVYILRDTLIYTKRWQASYYSVYRLAGKRMGIHAVKADGSNKQTIKDFDVGNNGYITVSLSGPNEVYFGVYNAAEVFYEYENGKLRETKEFGSEAFSKPYPTFLVSPGGTYTFWYEQRDGKNTLLSGDADGKKGREIASLSEYVPYGWYSDAYALVSKNSSELFVMPAGGVGAKGQILKISDYHKPSVNFYGYGYGYGGL